MEPSPARSPRPDRSRARPSVCPHCATAGLRPTGQIHEQIQEDNRSETGAEALAINLSLIHTAKCCQREAIPLIKSILLSGHRAAAEVLFNNSS